MLLKIGSVAPQTPVLPQGGDYAFDAAVDTLGAQDRQVDTLDSKVGVLLAAEGVLAGFVFGSAPGAIPSWATICAGVFVVASASLALLSFWPRRLARVPDAPTLARLAARHPAATASELKWQFVRNAVEGVEENRTVLHRKVWLIKGSAAALLATIGSLVAGAIWTAVRA